MGVSFDPLLPTALAFAVGLVLLLVGWRGRRVDDRPYCRRCRHELTGIDRTGACPECGRALDAPRAVRVGRRRRRWIALVIGVVLALPLPIVLGLRAADVGRAQWLRNAPTWVLVHGELRRSDPVAVGEALDELVQRAIDGNLPDAVIVEIAERGVARRLALAAPDPFGPSGDEASWTPTWGAFVAAAAAADAIPESTFVEYVVSGIRIEFTTGRSVRARVIHPRARTRTVALAPPRVLRLSTDGGPPLLVDTFSYPGLRIETRLSDVRVDGESMMRGSTSSSSSHTLADFGVGTTGPHLTLPDSTPGGEAAVSMAIDLRLTRADDGTDDALWERNGRLGGTVTILAEDVAYDRDAIAAAIGDSISRAFVMDEDATFRPDDEMVVVALDVAFDRVRWRVGWETRVEGHDDARMGGHGSTQVDGTERFLVRLRDVDPSRPIERLRLQVESIELLDPVLAPAPDALGDVPGMTLRIDVDVEPSADSPESREPDPDGAP